jgi:large subunit ribosomal protein L35
MAGERDKTRFWAVFAALSTGTCVRTKKTLPESLLPLLSPPLMSKNAGIAKTRKAVAKRFKVTATGKVLRRKQGKRHILQNKNRKRKRNLGKVALVAEVDVPAVKANLPFH